MFRSLILSLLLVVCWVSCEVTIPSGDIRCTWELQENRMAATLTIRNDSHEALDSSWILYFNQFQTPVVQNADATCVHITGDYHKISLPAAFHLPPGDSIKLDLTYQSQVPNVSYAPHGIYWTEGGNIHIPEVRTTGFDGTETVLARHRYHASASPHDPRIHKINEAVIFPKPASVTWLDGEGAIGRMVTVGFADSMVSEGRILAEVLTGKLQRENVQMTSNGGDIRLSVDSRLSAEHYTLTVLNDRVVITGGDRAGMFYGIQSLLQLAVTANNNLEQDSLTLPGCVIEDGPEFSYRGQHLDVARNFHDIPSVKRVIDLMAIFKLNKLHLTLTNDEGWRLEVPGLPELTEIASRRGHTINERDMLFPAYGSGPFPDRGSGSGYYSRKEYMDLLKYARDRHVEVIPEINIPGHARAAIVAMKERSRRLMATGDTSAALEYVLHDPGDRSQYVSPQRYSDNVICICRESAFRFVEKVFGELVAMHRDASVPLKMLHVGGDEIPVGAWTASPICQRYMEKKGILSVTGLQSAFMARLLRTAKNLEFTIAGWEEIVLAQTPEGHNTTEINEQMTGTPVLPYVWNAVWGWGREDMGYKLANAGFPVVLCNSSALYFDLAYTPHPLEPGLTWSGYVDTKAAFDFIPLHMFVNARSDISGDPLSPGYVASMTRLNNANRDNVLGIQGQLWSETLTDSEMIDYYLFPKMLGLAWRAWSPEPEWVHQQDSTAMLQGWLEEWREFEVITGQYVLPMLDDMDGGAGYRIPPPGVMVRNDTLYANVRFAPGLKLHYTTDGQDPTMDSPEYQEPVIVKFPVRIRAFNRQGRGSREVKVD